MSKSKQHRKKDTRTERLSILATVSAAHAPPASRETATILLLLHHHAFPQRPPSPPTRTSNQHLLWSTRSNLKAGHNNNCKEEKNHGQPQPDGSNLRAGPQQTQEKVEEQSRVEMKKPKGEQEMGTSQNLACALCVLREGRAVTRELHGRRRCHALTAVSRELSRQGSSSTSSAST